MYCNRTHGERYRGAIPAPRITVITKLVITAEPRTAGPCPASSIRPYVVLHRVPFFVPFASSFAPPLGPRNNEGHVMGGECRFRDGPGQPSRSRPRGKTPMVTYRYPVKCLLKSIARSSTLHGMHACTYTRVYIYERARCVRVWSRRFSPS